MAILVFKGCVPFSLPYMRRGDLFFFSPSFGEKLGSCSSNLDFLETSLELLCDGRMLGMGIL